MANSISLEWGESVAVREQFVRLMKTNMMIIEKEEFLSMNYSPFEGDEQLIKTTKEVIFRQLGYCPKHVILTNGAAGGVVIAMRAFAHAGRTRVWVNNPPYFSLYPAMIRASGLMPTARLMARDADAVILLDSPSNPEGLLRTAPVDLAGLPIIWDAVYANNVYTEVRTVIPADVVVGSYSKLTGLNGIRIGWIASDNDFYMQRVKELVSAEYCGLSVPSVAILNHILPNFPWEDFERSSRAALNDNRELWSKLEKFFGGKPTPQSGMFYYGPMDNSCQRLFEKASIKWTPGVNLGDSNDFGRFNIGHSTSVLKNVVAQILKADKISV